MAAELYAKATDAFFDEDYDEALELYSKALDQEPNNAEFLLRRCTTYQKLKRYNEALDDASKALDHLNSSQGSRSLLARAHLQKGIVLHHISQYPEAQQHFDSANALNPNEKTLATWLRKNAEKLPPKSATPATISATDVPPNTVFAQQQQPTTATPQNVRARHEWFQNDSFVTVEVFIKNVKQENVTVDFTDRELSLTIKMPTASDYSLELDPLAHEIVPKESSFKVLSTKIEIKLKKKTEGIKWGTLEGEDVVPASMAPASVSSARKPKDWNALVRDIEKDQEKPEGEAALNALFQQIYSNADDDTKRAMMKSFVESNGTCLSTNWAEVGSKKVETKPPEGMVAKKYEV
ncbi:hypothetical protein VTP01DRAFT_5585 [Rhizomucor pusillus]|uniref:uncharacterized protein n=1 Tax=Rhizomucor pusillus TaxID=4840 RepID=UPI003742508C